MRHNILKKAIFIIPYFGEFPIWFQLFLNSCRENKDYDWLILTDNTKDYDYPKNVIIKKMTFAQVKGLVQKSFDFKVRLDKPYKFCDLKPMYGFIFKDLVKEYPFWGHCDLDLIFGKIDDFISQADFETFDKIGNLGHFTLYKNIKFINEAFMLPLNGKLRYKEILQSSKNFSFDEENEKSINSIFYEHHLPMKENLKLAGLYTKTSNFKLVNPDDNWKYHVEKKSKNFFVWNKGILMRYTKNTSNESVSKEEYLYIHFQSRKMKMTNKNFEIYKIIPNSFDDLEVNKITYNDFPKYKHFNLHYFRLRSANLVDKIRKRIEKND